MAGEELIAKTRRAFDAWSSGDAEVLAAELADDVPPMALSPGKIDGERVVVLYTLEFDGGSCDGADRRLSTRR